MQEHIQNIILQQNVKLSQLNDEELSQFAEYCFDIISQFLDIDIDSFMITFHDIAYDNILNETNNEEDDEEQDDDEIDLSSNFYLNYYKYLDEMEKEYYTQIKEIQKLKQDLAPIQVQRLTKRFQPEQRSPEWYDIRYNMLTASDFGAIIGYSKYDTPEKIILKKCGHSSFKGNIYTWHGQKYEPVATSVYESRYNTTVLEFGLLQHETIPFLGASPDGITLDGIMIEIKCPYTRKLTGDIMDKATLSYYAQIQLQLEVCDLQVCDFWECQFDTKGYTNLESYLADKYIPENISNLDIIPQKQYSLDHIKVSNDRRSSNGLEKGMIVTIKKQGDNEYSYLYPPFHYTTQQQLDWINQHDQSQYDIFDIVYWRLIKTSICRVDRDRMWFQEKIPTVTKFWKTVQQRRKTGCEDLLPKKRKNNILDLSSSSLKSKSKSKPKPIKNKPTKFMFNIPDDDSD